MSRTGVFVCYILCALFLCGSAHAESVAIPFQEGERLSFQIYWSFIPAAHVSLEVVPVERGLNGIPVQPQQGLNRAPAEDGGSSAAYHFVLTATTLPVVDLIYKYRERIDSFAADNVQHTLLYKKVQDSSHPRDIVVQFDWDKGVARYANYGKASSPIPIQPGTLDPLAALYYIRTQALNGEFKLEQWVTDGKKLSRGQARFIQKETLSIQGKTYHTIKIEPDLQDVGGVFEKSPGAKMFIWLTDDERKILVKLKSKVIVGSFVAELIEEESVIPEDKKSLYPSGGYRTESQTDSSQ